MEVNFQRVVKVASCTLNQWAMDFEGNKRRIIESLKKCVENGTNIRIGPELEISGYGCEDHFLEEDTIRHSWEVLYEILIDKNNYTEKMLCDFGMPIIHKGVIYNCRVLVYNNQILLIRPKIALADDGCYHENRFFTAWKRGFDHEDFILPNIIQNIKGQKQCKFGLGIFICCCVSLFLIY